MDINYFNEDFPYITIKNTYTESELELIWEELNFISSSEIFLNSKNPYFGSAISDNKILRNNKSIWLDDFYSSRENSNILRINRKLFTEYNKIFDPHPSWLFKNFECTEDNTLISYYENGGYYKKHKDYSFFTALTWFYKEPKRFSGGDLYMFLDNTSIKIEIKNNYTLIFPSLIFHEVSKISMNSENENKKLGRFCMTQFLKSR
jgi:Rps23 Pro-64 3,4-dihydroxylase Tpa1-like proline 4-hydroxylase